jgi:hypothetical protein
MTTLIGMISTKALLIAVLILFGTIGYGLLCVCLAKRYENEDEDKDDDDNAMD